MILLCLSGISWLVALACSWSSRNLKFFKIPRAVVICMFIVSAFFTLLTFASYAGLLRGFSEFLNLYK